MKAQDLRNSILQLAIQGKLVEQNPNDEPADVLYEKIQAEKQKLIKEGKIKKDKPLPPITEDEIPFSIPPTWKLVRVGEIAFMITDGTHSTPKYTYKGIPFISVKDISSGYIDFSNTKFISEEEHYILSQRCHPEQGDLLLTKVGTTGIPVIVNTQREFSLFVSVALLKLSKVNINVEFLKQIILSPFVQEQASNNTKGVGNKNWVIKDIANTIIPLPPLEEQKRIVDKIEELEPLIKQYDKAEEELSNLNEKFPEQLKKSILQYAIQGKLVEQNSNDEPADILYEKIQAEKQKLIKEGKIKKDKPLPPITEDEIPFSIPTTWKWVRLENIIYSVPTKNYQILQSLIKKSGIYPVVSQSLDLIEGYYDDDKKLFYHDIPIIIFGDHTRCLKLIDFNFIVGADGVKILRPYFNYTKYLYYTLSYFIINMKNRGYSRHYQFIKNQLIPLPPLDEQKRIVEKVSSLLEYCDKLK